ncbi:hypothetical protein Dimus_008791 [Dionaea muscipula]
MLGTKRRNVSLRAEAEDSSVIFQSKRVLSEPSSYVQGVESCKQQVASAETLDLHQAESSRQHVRALNTQFASWVQSQLQNHPDELWEDGVRDYLAHASNILEKFSDVVNWLKANGSKGGGLAAIGTQTAEQKLSFESKTSEAKLLPGKHVSFTNAFSSGALSNNPASSAASAPSFVPSWSSGVSSSNLTSVLATPQAFAPSSSSGVSFSSQTSVAATSSGFPSLWSSGVSSSSHQASYHSTSATFANSWGSKAFSNNLIPPPASTTLWSTGTFSTSQRPFMLGSQSAAPSNEDAADEADADGENEEQPGSPSVKRTEELGILVAHEVKCKLYVKSSDPADTDPWKDKGTGQLSIKCKEGESKGTKDSKPVIVVRNDVGRILLNASLYPGIKTNLLQKNALMTILHTVGDSGEDSQVMPRTFLIRTKNEEERNKLAEVIQEYAPVV